MGRGSGRDHDESLVMVDGRADHGLLKYRHTLCSGLFSSPEQALHYFTKIHEGEQNYRRKLTYCAESDM